MNRSEAQRLSPELVVTPIGPTSGLRMAQSAINWAVTAQEGEHQQRSMGMRAERLVMGDLGATPEHLVPTATPMALSVGEQVSHERAGTSVSETEEHQQIEEHLQNMRTMRDDMQTFASDMSRTRVQVSKNVEQIRLEHQYDLSLIHI